MAKIFFFSLKCKGLSEKRQIMICNSLVIDLPPLDSVTSGSGGIARGGRGKYLEAGSVEMEVGGSGWCRGGKN